MATVLSIIAVIILAGSLFLVGCNKLPLPPKSTCTGQEITTQGIKSLQKCQVEDMLLRIERSSESGPKNYAMCYKQMLPLDYAEYICPICGQRTKHEKRYAELIARDLPEIKSEFNKLLKDANLAMRLDENSLCAHCTPDAKQRGLFLVISYADGTEIRSTLWDKDDIFLLKDFLDGQLLPVHGNKVGTFTIKKEIPHLRKLLGMPKVDEKKE